MRARLAVAALLFVLANEGWGAASKGGEWSLIRSASGCGGNSSVSGGVNKVSQSCGAPYGILLPMAGGPHRLASGYLSHIPSRSAVPLILLVTSSGGVAGTGTALVSAPGDPVRIVFSSEMSSASLSGAIRVTAAQDSMGNTISSTMTLSLTYNDLARAAEVTRQAAGWPKGTTFELFVTTGARDRNGVAVVSATTFTFVTSRDPAAAAATVVGGGGSRVEVSIPAGTFTADFFIVASTGVATQATDSATAKITGSGGDRRPPISVVRIDPYQASGAAWSAPLARNVQISMSYPDADGDGKVDGTNPPIDAKTLSLWRLDEFQQLWVKQTAATINEASRQVNLSSNHFSIYALIGSLNTDVSDVYAYPVPFRPNAGDPARYGCWTGCLNNGIAFTNLPDAGTIKVYSITGQLVRQLDITSTTGRQNWDVRNSGGEIVASGLYLWEVRSGKNRKTGKLVVIK